MTHEQFNARLRQLFAEYEALIQRPNRASSTATACSSGTSTRC